MENREISLLVSIHALLAECDATLRNNKSTIESFNPRTPCGVRPTPETINQTTERFQSTHSLRSATFFLLMFHDGNNGFNPRTPCGVRPSSVPSRMGSPVFQSTHSLRSATPCSWHVKHLYAVSIHALLAECDSLAGRMCAFMSVSIHALLAECDMGLPSG